ncbi:VOC family protein [Pararhodobacter sp.]|uniref:VOC family protein n=1 Tax=Pararhodobacter sp. TaxID=2127056 RepID=UPI002AFE627B|nr:VOC family protein [Pararhodobacter sp.]
MSIAFDHFVLLVNDLDAAARDFEALGFTVLERADTSHGTTIFKFVSFADGSYILLTAFTSDEGRKGHRLGTVLDAGEGWADYSFVVPDATAAGTALVSAGFAARGPVSVSNVLAGGEKWGLDLLMTGRGAGGDAALPFLISDVEGRGHRIPGPSTHANGATGIASVTVSSANPRRVADTLVAIGGKDVATPHAIRVHFGAEFVEILTLEAAPNGRPGGGIVSVTLKGGAAGQALDLTLAHNAPMVFSEGQA